MNKDMTLIGIKFEWEGICNYCGREMPNKKWRTKNGCKWCDAEYHRRKNENIPSKS